VLVSFMSLWLALSLQTELHKEEEMRSKMFVAGQAGMRNEIPVKPKVFSGIQDIQMETLQSNVKAAEDMIKFLKAQRQEGKDRETKLQTDLNEVKAKLQKTLVDNFFVATRSATLLDHYEDQLSALFSGDGFDSAYLPVLDEPKGLVDPSSLTPGVSWWDRPNKGKYALKERPESWAREDPEAKSKRWGTIRKVLQKATEAAGTQFSTEQWKKFAEAVPQRVPPKILSGTGVVIAGGGPVYFSSAWVIVRQLRAVGCYWPVELWVTKGETVPADVEKLLNDEGVYVEDASNLLADEQDGTGQAERVASGMDKRFPLKAIALTFSRFRHVLSLDADNFPAHNPERLLRSGGYVRTGALFWPDFWPLERANPIWDHISKKI